MSPRLRISARELMMYLRNYGTVAWATFQGGIECFVKESILPSLEFSDFEKCIDCIKSKYVKQIKKNEKKCRDIRNNSYGYL
jgi:aspartate ammonia-lyase